MKFNNPKPTCYFILFSNQKQRGKKTKTAFSFPLTFMSGAKGATALSLAHRNSFPLARPARTFRGVGGGFRGVYCGISFDSLIPTAGFLVGSFALHPCACWRAMCVRHWWKCPARRHCRRRCDKAYHKGAACGRGCRHRCRFPHFPSCAFPGARRVVRKTGAATKDVAVRLLNS